MPELFHRISFLKSGSLLKLSQSEKKQHSNNKDYYIIGAVLTLRSKNKLQGQLQQPKLCKKPTFVPSMLRYQHIKPPCF